MTCSILAITVRTWLAPVARTVLDYFMLGKTPAGMDQPTPEDETADEEEGGD